MLPVLYPYTRRHQPVAAGAPDHAVWVDVSSDDLAYWRVMCEWWERGEGFAVVEHDVVCRPDVISGFETCPQPWCVHPYTPICHPECMEAWANMLGCTRFSAEVIAACPDAVSGIPPEGRDWHNLCDWIAGDKRGGMPAELWPGSLRHAGYAHHWHHPAVEHITWLRYEQPEGTPDAP